MAPLATELTVLQLNHLQSDFHSSGTWPVFWQFPPVFLKFPQPLFTIPRVFSHPPSVKLTGVVIFRGVFYTRISRGTALRSEVHSSYTCGEHLTSTHRTQGDRVSKEMIVFSIPCAQIIHRYYRYWLLDCLYVQINYSCYFSFMRFLLSLGYFVNLLKFIGLCLSIQTLK